MNILVLIAGVHDPKWPVTPDGEVASQAGDHKIMSPFDEAALEMALRVRDADPSITITVRVAGGTTGSKIARAVAALKIRDVATVGFSAAWDQLTVARALAPLCASADLILMGREFGDYDDGLVPPALAGMVDLPFFSRAQTIEADDALRFSRDADTVEEMFTIKGPALISVTNDRRTRLRKPLMKNVMIARTIEIGEVVSASHPTAGLTLDRMTLRPAGRGQTQCQMLEGGPAQQAEALAALLWEARA